MSESLKSERTIRDYLLGRLSDEATLEGIEELLFTDEEFCYRVALAEDEIINDFVLGYLDKADAVSFRATLAADPERRSKLELTERLRAKALAESAQAPRPAHAQAVTPQRAQAPRPERAPSILASLADIFRRPAYAGIFALLLVAVLASVFFLFRRGGADELAKLRALYRQERPTEARLSDFDYAPHTQLRGGPAPGEQSQLRRYENTLLEDAERSPSAQTFHALGYFYLMQRKFPEAVAEFEKALKSGGGSTRIHNDLGAAYFELARTSPRERRLEHLGRALEEFTKASELDAGSREALFNKSLTLQELGLPRQAKESWTLYLQKDPSSPWAEEARRHLARLGDAQTRFKRDEQVLEDFLEAYRNHDDALARRIHNETKGSLKGVAVPLQLSRRYLTARRGGDEAAARESIEALTYLGDYERAQHSEFFFLNWPASTPASARTRRKNSCAPRRFSTAGSLTS